MQNSKIELLQNIIPNDLPQKIVDEFLKECYNYIDMLWYNEGINIHLNETEKDSTDSYKHISFPELSHKIIVENNKISIYKYQLIFNDLVYNIKVPLTLYKVYPKFLLEEQKEIVNTFKEYFKASINVLFTVSSKYGMHLPFHIDDFSKRYHQKIYCEQSEVLEFVTGDKVLIKEGYIIKEPKVPHRVVLEKSERERVFLSCSVV